MSVNLSKNTVTPYNQAKPGTGQAYDSYLTYDEDPDTMSGNARTYNTIGEASAPVNLAKNSASPTNQNKS